MLSPFHDKPFLGYLRITCALRFTRTTLYSPYLSGKSLALHLAKVYLISLFVQHKSLVGFGHAVGAALNSLYWVSTVGLMF